MLQAQQRWRFTAVPEAGGYPGSPWFHISIADTERTLAATPDGEPVVAARYTGAPAQLWRIDTLADGTFRLVPKSSQDPQALLALSAVGSSTPTLAPFHPQSDEQRWNIKAP